MNGPHAMERVGSSMRFLDHARVPTTNIKLTHS